MSKKQTLIEKTIVTKKDFSYKRGDCVLSFTLKTDDSSELRAFLSCLEEAVNDVNGLLKGMKN